MSANEQPKPISAPLLRWSLRLYFKLFYSYKARGQENLPATGPLLIASNHQSYFDPVLLAIGQNHPMSFMAWAALFKQKLFARLIRWAGAFPVDLDRTDPGAFRTALTCLRQGQWVVLFPEGGRSEDGGLLDLREGVARLSLHTGAPILPVRIEGAFEAWPKPRPKPYLFKPVRVFYGPPIEPPPGARHMSPEARDRAAREMMEKLKAFIDPKREHPEVVPSAKK